MENKKRKPLPDSIAVKPGSGETNRDILTAIKQSVDIENIGAKVATITESRNGEILIRLCREDTKKNELIAELKTKLEGRAAKRSLIKYEDVNIQVLDSVTTEADVELGIRSTLNLTLDEPR